MNQITSTADHRRFVRGVVCATMGGVCWGFSGTCGQFLFSQYEVSSLWLTCVRMLSTGVIMFCMALPHHREPLLGIWKDPKDRIGLICYGIFGLMLCQFSYMTGISWSNAATTTVLQTLSLVLIMLIACIQARRKPVVRETVALALALLGTWILATGGNPREMAISPQGLFWGLMTAVAVTIYSMLPRKLLPRWGKQSLTANGMLIGGVVLSLGGRVWNYQVSLPPAGWLAMAAIVLLGSVAAFSLFMQGVADVGPVKTSMLAATEPVSATIFSALWLGTQFSVPDLVGFVCIVVTIFLLANSE